MDPVRLVFCGLNVYMLYIFFSFIFDRKTDMKKTVVYGIVVALFIFLINLQGDTRLNLAVVPICYLVYAWFVFRVNPNQAIAYTVIFTAIFAGGREVAFELLLRYLTNLLPFHIPLWFTSAGVPLLILEYLIGYLFLRYIGRFTPKLDTGEDKAFPWLLVLYPLSAMVVFWCFLYMDFPNSRLIQFLICLSSFVLYFSNAVIFIVLERFRRMVSEANRVELQEVRQGMENKNFQDLREFNERSQQFMHDVHLHLRAIRELAMKGEIQKICERVDCLEGEMKTAAEGAVYSSNPILDSVFRDMYQRALDKGIELSAFVEPSVRVDFLVEDDMISIFGNLIDNAIEAADRCGRGERKISAKLYMGNDFLLVFFIKNSYLGPLRWEGEQLLTEKNDSRPHGMGIRIVQALAEKYGGTLGLHENAEEHTFAAILTVSVLTGNSQKRA